MKILYCITFPICINFIPVTIQYILHSKLLDLSTKWLAALNKVLFSPYIRDTSTVFAICAILTGLENKLCTDLMSPGSL